MTQASTCYTNCGLTFNVIYSKPSFQIVKTSIDAGEPVYVSCQKGKSGHAVLLRGYADGTTPSVSYMDPNFSNFRAQSYSNFTVQDDKTIQGAIYNPHP